MCFGLGNVAPLDDYRRRSFVREVEEWRAWSLITMTHRAIRGLTAGGCSSPERV